MEDGAMEGIRTTFRIDAVVKDGLVRLSKLQRTTLNHLANEAIKEFVARRTLEIENELESTLDELRAYRKSDPDFEKAIARFVQAETTVEHDPAEGRVIRETGRTESAVLDLLNE